MAMGSHLLVQMIKQTLFSILFSHWRNAITIGLESKKPANSDASLAPTLVLLPLKKVLHLLYKRVVNIAVSLKSSY